MLSAIKEQNEPNMPPEDKTQTAGQQIQRNLQCPTHPSYDITNICINPQCLEPLCPKCIVQHIQQHNQLGTYAEIELIEDKRGECIQYVRKIKEVFQQEKQMLNCYNDTQKGDFERRCQETIQKSKQRVLALVEQYYTRYSEMISKEMAQNLTTHPGQYNQIEQRVNTIVGNISEIERRLCSGQYIKDMIDVGALPASRGLTRSCSSSLLRLIGALAIPASAIQPRDSRSSHSAARLPLEPFSRATPA